MPSDSESRSLYLARRLQYMTVSGSMFAQASRVRGFREQFVKVTVSGRIWPMRRPSIRNSTLEEIVPMAHKATTSETKTPTSFHVSVLCCRKTGRVLFLEAGKDFVDTLLSFLLLPVGTILHMLSNGLRQVKPLGGISSVFESVKNMESSFLNVDKKTLVEPRPAGVGTCLSSGLLPGLNTPAPSIKLSNLPQVYYKCGSGSCVYLSTKSGTLCSSCRRGSGYAYSTAMTVLPKDLEELEAMLVADFQTTSSPSGPGFVRENITYMVTDSLEVMPSTTIRSLRVVTKMKLATLADLESREVTVDITQVLQLLRSALTSSTCLNDVFG